MATVEQYRHYVKQLLEKYASYSTGEEGLETQIIEDEKHDHYQLFHLGWRNNRRIYGCIWHIDIKNQKFWIQHDGTEIGMAMELVDLGVPKTDIVLAFHAPFKRKYTEFAEG